MEQSLRARERTASKCTDPWRAAKSVRVIQVLASTTRHHRASRLENTASPTLILMPAAAAGSAAVRAMPAATIAPSAHPENAFIASCTRRLVNEPHISDRGHRSHLHAAHSMSCAHVAPPDTIHIMMPNHASPVRDRPQQLHEGRPSGQMHVRDGCGGAMLPRMAAQSSSC